MRIVRLLAVIALATVAASPIAAQERRTASDQDVLTQGTIPAPEDPSKGAIIMLFGQVSQVYFKYPFKSIRVADPFTVTAQPLTDHIIAFTGLSPGKTEVTLEAPDGKQTNYAIVLIARPLHEVKVYTPKPLAKTDAKSGASITIVNSNSTGEPQAKDSDEPEYKSILCNDIGCQPVPKPLR